MSISLGKQSRSGLTASYHESLAVLEPGDKSNFSGTMQTPNRPKATY
ncbi:hypothetical protein ABIB49_001530 [Arthrobacter sp. UYCu512]